MPQPSLALQAYWDRSLKQMPRKDVQTILKQLGFSFPTGSLSDEEVRKVLYGLLLKLDEQDQIEAVQAINGDI